MNHIDLYKDPNKIDWKTPVVIDFETYYDKEYSLSKITTEKYIRCDKFECIGVAVKIGNNPTYFHKGETGVEIIRHIVTTTYPNSPVVAHNCLTGDHEVRTMQGWKRLDELDGTEQILQWHSDTGIAEFTDYKPFSKVYNGNMYEHDTNYHKGVYTADHRVYFNTPRNQEWRVDTAENVAKRHHNHIYLPIGFIVHGDNTLFTSTEIMLLEVIRADGYIDKGRAHFHFSKQRKIDRLKYICGLLNLPIKIYQDRGTEKDTYSIYVTGEIIGRINAILGKPKQLGEWVLTLPVDVRLAWLDEIKYWDGSMKSNHQYIVSTANKNHAYWLCELALFTGWQASVKYDCPNNRGWSKPDGVLHYVTVRNKQRVKFVEKPKVYEYNGMVYCVSVPSKAFIVRRKGKVWITGNCSFDLGILAFRYGIHPNFMVDTMVMAKLSGFDRVAGGTSLAKMSAQLEKMGIFSQVKGNEVHNMLGVHAGDMTPRQWQAYGDYCKLDVDLTHSLYMYMIDKVPVSELIMSDITTKMYTKPMFDIDVPLLEQYAVRLETERDEMLERIAGQLGFNDNKTLLSNLRSSKKFVAILERLNVTVPMKWSEKKQEMIPAVSKTDTEFLDLLEHDDALVRTLVETKLGTMSSLAQTRTENFLDIASRGLFPVALRYASAHTGRYGGGDGNGAKGSTNVQNLPKRTGDTTLRKSLRAKDGHVVIATDSTQVELRVNSLIACQQDAIDVFTSGRDPYVDMATAIFNRPYDEIYHEAKVVGSKEGKKMRNLGKEVCLAGGYGMSANTFRERMNLAGQAEASQMADDLITAYRAKNYKIVQFWRECDRVLKVMYAGGSCWFGGPDNNLFYADGSSVFHGVKIPSIRFPNGTYLYYQNLRIERGDNGREQFVYDQFKGRAWMPNRVWGSLFDENLTQKLAFDILKWQAIEIAKAGVPVNLNVHDEWVSVVPRDQAPQAVVVHYTAMKSVPDYIPQGLLDCEVDVGLTYADLKTVDVGRFL